MSAARRSSPRTSSHDFFSINNAARNTGGNTRRSNKRGGVKREEDGEDEGEDDNGMAEQAERAAAVKRESAVKAEKAKEEPQAKDEAVTSVRRGRSGAQAAVKQEQEQKQEPQQDSNGRGSRKRGRAAVKHEQEAEEVGDEEAVSQSGDAANASAEKEGGEGDGEDNEEWDGVKDSVDKQLTYEQQRQANIRRNLQQMQMLQLTTILPPMSSAPSASSNSSAGKRKKVYTAQPRQRTMPTRRSLRGLGLDPEGNEAVIREGEGRYVPELPQWTRPARREGSIPLGDIKVEVRGSYNVEAEKEEKEQIVIDEVELLDDDDDDKKDEKAEADESAKPPRDADIDGLCAAFKALAPSTNSKKRASKAPFSALTPDAIGRLHPMGMTNKLVRKRCTTLAFHPSSNSARSILVAGDKTGEMGVLCYGEVGRMREEGKNVQCAFSVHEGGINSFCFSSLHEYCYSASNDGTLRQLSFDYQQYLEAFVNEDEMSLLTVTSSAQHPNSLFACDRKGDLIVLDTSSSSLTQTSRTSLSHLKVNCVTVHPGGHLLASCGNDRTVRLWDLRHLRDDTPLHTFEHGYSVNSVYFSPSGDRLLSTCIDDYVRVWNVAGEDVQAWPDVTRIRHNNQTGRWVTLFKAKWTMTDDAFLIGNMSRQVDLYAWDGTASGGGGGGAKGKGKGASVEAVSVPAPEHHAMTSSELTAIPSAVAIHPTNEYFVGATASSYAYLWGLC
ncbi:hypothetical protein MMC34_008553 [Xylographa carneopallida]|nr:hypothetical protein [Xylographa carneopallida]